MRYPTIMKYWSKSAALHILWLTCVIAGSVAHAGERYEQERLAMVEEIEADVRLTRLSLDREVLDPRVLQAMASVPRHALVPERVRAAAYENRPLSIGHGQTISQPYIVAIMTDLLDTTADSRVLEIGTGSGYQAAVLAGIVAQVYTMEIIEPLGLLARHNLEELGYDNVTVQIGDGYYGWEEQAPFDAIVVTAAASHIPPPLIKQLKPGGRMMIPVGSRYLVQQLVVVEKDREGKVVTRQILPVRFVPLTGSH